MFFNLLVSHDLHIPTKRERETSSAGQVWDSFGGNPLLAPSYINNAQVKHRQKLTRESQVGMANGGQPLLGSTAQRPDCGTSDSDTPWSLPCVPLAQFYTIVPIGWTRKWHLLCYLDFNRCLSSVPRICCASQLFYWTLIWISVHVTFFGRLHNILNSIAASQVWDIF